MIPCRCGQSIIELFGHSSFVVMDIDRLRLPVSRAVSNVLVADTQKRES